MAYTKRTVINTGGTNYDVLVDSITESGQTGDAQAFKLVDGTNSGTAVAVIDANGAIQVSQRQARTRVAGTSAGLTTATTAYTSGDQLGTILTLASVLRTSGAYSVLEQVRVLDKADVTGQLELVFFRASVTLAADNAAFSVSDTDMDSLIGTVSVGMVDYGANRAGIAYPDLRVEAASGTSIFMALMTRTDHTFFGAATDIAYVCTFAQH